MDDFLLQIFKDQVMIQSHYFIASWREFAITIFEGDDPKVAGTTPASKPRKNFSIERAFYSVQNCLNSAANMSKIFWGASGKLVVQRKPVRDFFGVADNSPLNDVDMRNNFEHFDERIDRWFATSKSRRFVDLNFGDVKKRFPTFDDIDFFRNYDPSTHDVRFWDVTFNMNKVAGEVERIRRVVEP